MLAYRYEATAMAYSEPLRTLEIKGPAAIEDGKAKEKSFVVVSIYSGGPKTEGEKYETIRYTFIDGTAKFEEDYGPRRNGSRSGNMRINFGGGTGAIFVPIIVDSVTEEEEHFFVRFDRLNESGQSATIKITIVNRPPDDPAPLPLPLVEPAPAWWPPGFGQFDDEPKEQPDSNGGDSGGGSRGTTGSNSEDSGGGSRGTTGSNSGDSCGGSRGSTGSSSGDSGGGSRGSTGSSSEDSGGGSRGTTGSNSGDSGGGSRGSTGSNSGDSGGRSREELTNSLNEKFDITNLNSNNIISRTRSLKGQEIEIFYVDMSKFGTPEEDNMGGSKLPDFINLLEGNDWFTGGRSDDEIYGQQGQDTLLGNQGNDFIAGNLGNDYIFGGKDSDYLYGNKGNDKLYGNRADDFIWGGEGDDYIYGGKNNDKLFGDQGDDKLFGNRANDSIWAGPGDDWIYGNEQQDILWGNAGNDYLNGGKNDDILWGGDGADLFSLSKGLDIIKDFRITDGDKLTLPLDTNFVLMEKEGSAFLLTDKGSFLIEGVTKNSFEASNSIHLL